MAKILSYQTLFFSFFFFFFSFGLGGGGGGGANFEVQWSSTHVNC